MSPRKPHRRASSGPTAKGAAEVPAATEATDLLGQASDDDPRVWGDSPENRDSWLLEQRPPHWD